MNIEEYVDPEVVAMAAIVEAFRPIDSDARVRVLRWATARYVMGEKRD